MPQRINNVDIGMYSGFFYAMGNLSTYLNISGLQVLGAIVGSVFIVTTMRNERPTVKALNFLGSFFMGILGAHLVAGFIAGLPYMPSTVTPQSAIGWGAIISAACGLIVLRRLHKAAKSKSLDDVKNMGGKRHD